MRLSETLAILSLMVAVYAQTKPPLPRIGIKSIEVKNANGSTTAVGSPAQINLDWAADLMKRFREAFQKQGGITVSNGTVVVTHNIGGRTYTAKFPLKTSIIQQGLVTTNKKGERTEKLVLNVNGDVTVYETENGRTTVTDEKGKIRADGGPFGIKSAALPSSEIKSTEVKSASNSTAAAGSPAKKAEG